MLPRGTLGLKRNLGWATGPCPKAATHAELVLQPTLQMPCGLASDWQFHHLFLREITRKTPVLLELLECHCAFEPICDTSESELTKWRINMNDVLPSNKKLFAQLFRNRAATTGYPDRQACSAVLGALRAAQEALDRLGWHRIAAIAPEPSQQRRFRWMIDSNLRPPSLTRPKSPFTRDHSSWWDAS